MDQSLATQAHTLTAAIRKDAGHATNTLVRFANTYAYNEELRHSALTLRLGYLRAQTKLRKEQLQQDMLALVAQIVMDSREPAAADVARKEAVQQMYDRYRAQDARADEVVFKSVGLGRRFDRTGFVLEGVDLELRLGEITGVVGENANGKTTLFRLIAGELKHDRGTLSYPCIDRGGGATSLDWLKIKSQIGYVPQILPTWYGSLRDNLHYAAATHGILGEENIREVDYIIERLDLAEHVAKSWRELSGGFRLRFALAGALVWKPKLLILDEPLASLDFKTQLTVLRDLRDLADSLPQPMSVVLSSQHLHEIEGIADNILFLERGKVTYAGSILNIGTDRDHNTFELGTHCDENTLQILLDNPTIHSLYHNGLYYVILTDKDCTLFDLIQILEQQELDFFISEI
jgi:ABC-2 type transport system ATP-binding protein